MKLNKFISKNNLEELFVPQDVDVAVYEFFAKGTTNGYYENKGINVEEKILVLTNDDYAVLSSASESELESFFGNLKTVKIIIISDSFDFELIKHYVIDKEFIILKSDKESADLISMINYYLSKKNAKLQRVHGTLVNIYGEGVLIIGKSGIGKSELAMELISKGHQFVGDDAIDVFSVSNKIIGKSAPITKNLLEVRGLGVVNVQKTFGIQSLLNESRIDLVIELVELESVITTIERLGNNITKYTFDAGKVDLIQVPVSSGRNISSIVESAVNVFKLKKYDNYFAADELKAKQEDE